MAWFETEKEYLGTKIYCQYESDKERSGSIWSIAEKLEQKFSRFRPESELSQFNQSLETWHKIDEEWYHLLLMAEDLKLQTYGALDITVKSFLDDWGYDADYSLQEKKSKPDLGIVELGPCKFRATAPIDLGSIGKSYFLDLIVQWANGNGIQNIFMSAGGDIYARGQSPEYRPWKTFFQDPRNSDLVIGELSLDDQFLCSSSPMHRRWRDRHHLVSPDERCPADDMQAVYIQSSQSGIMADGWSTALFALGFESAQLLSIEKALAVMLVSQNGEIWRSPQFSGTLYTT